MTGDSLRDARRSIRNAVEWIQPRTLEWILSDMAALEIMNGKNLRSQITPASTPASQYGVNKRRRSNAGTVKSQSSLSPSHISISSKPRSTKRARKI